MRLVAYLRVSSEGQVEGYGLDVQEKAVREFAKRGGHRLTKIITDAGVSGATDALDRPGLAAALGALREGEADGLLVARLDRLARALTVQEATLAICWAAGAQVLSVDQGVVLRDDPDDPMRTALRQVVGVFSELERRLVTKRLRDGRTAKAAVGRKAVGAYAYGYKAGGQGRSRDAVVDPAEAAVVARVLALRAAGHSYAAIAHCLNGQALPAKRGGRWHAMTVRAVVLRAADTAGQA
jgi:DNA invertase Pin-like site-specific DNA recombinase